MTEHSSPIRVFISYSWKDKGFVTGLCEKLRLLNVPIWFDRLELDSKDRDYTEAELKSLLRSSLMRCSAVVIVLNEFSESSTWVAYELTTANEIRAQRPDFQIVALATETPTSCMLSDFLTDATVLDFSSGYTTALAKLGKILSRELNISSGHDIQAIIVSSSRRLCSGVNISAHMKSCGLVDERISRLEALRNELVRFEGQPRVTDVVGLVEILDTEGCYDSLISGNLPIQVGEQGDQYALAFSFIPTFSFTANRLSNMNEQVRLVIISIWPSSEKPSTINMSTLMAEYNQNGSCFLWLSHDACMHRYTMGSDQIDSILLTENREMGDRESAFRWPNNNPDENLLYHRQALANKLYLGEVQQGQKFEEPRGLGIKNASAYMLWKMVTTMEKTAPQVLLTEPKGWASEVWSSAISGKWQQPEVSQSTALLGYLNMGGMLLFEVSARSSISPILAEQLKHMVQCASGHVFELGIDLGDKTVQYVCVSPRWVDMIQGYTEI